jgi:hypothetical protein
VSLPIFFLAVHRTIVDNLASAAAFGRISVGTGWRVTLDAIMGNVGDIRRILLRHFGPSAAISDKHRDSDNDDKVQEQGYPTA